MIAADTGLWKFTANVNDDSRVVCPECREDSPLAAWVEGEAYCELCGSHPTMVCPKCGEGQDHVWAGTIEVL